MFDEMGEKKPQLQPLSASPPAPLRRERGVVTLRNKISCFVGNWRYQYG